MTGYRGFPYALHSRRRLDTLRPDLDREEREYRPGSENR
jgi:hypothetical protein